LSGARNCRCHCRGALCDQASPVGWLANACVDVAPSNSPWQATFGVRNLFDRRYDLTRNFFGNRPSTADDLNVAAAGQPRTWTATVSCAY